MNRLLLFIALLLPFSLTGQSSSEENAIEEWTKPFVAAAPGENDLRAYEQRAIQKLKDLMAYLEIVADTSQNLQLREHTADQARKLFDHDTCWFAPWNLDTGMHAGDMKQIIGHDRFPSTTFINPIVSVPLKRVYKGVYRGKISYQASGRHPEWKLEIPIVLKQVEKRFGRQTQQIWRVFLSGLE